MNTNELSASQLEEMAEQKREQEKTEKARTEENQMNFFNDFLPRVISVIKNNAISVNIKSDKGQDDVCYEIKWSFPTIEALSLLEFLPKAVEAKLL